MSIRTIFYSAGIHDNNNKLQQHNSRYIYYTKFVTTIFNKFSRRSQTAKQIKMVCLKTASAKSTGIDYHEGRT